MIINELKRNRKNPTSISVHKLHLHLFQRRHNTALTTLDCPFIFQYSVGSPGLFYFDYIFLLHVKNVKNCYCTDTPSHSWYV